VTAVLQVVRITYSNFAGIWICLAIREVGRNGRVREVDFSGNELTLKEAGRISEVLFLPASACVCLFFLASACLGLI